MAETTRDELELSRSSLELDTAWPTGDRHVVRTPWSPARPETLVVFTTLPDEWA